MSAAPRVLLVEDNDDDVLFARLALEKIGARISLEVARDGEEALGMLLGSAEPPALVLLDINMPRMDGFEVLARLRESEFARRVPVVMLTTSDRPADLEKARLLGCDDYLVKPIGREAFSAALKAILQRYVPEALDQPPAV